MWRESRPGRRGGTRQHLRASRLLLAWPVFKEARHINQELNGVRIVGKLGTKVLKAVDNLGLDGPWRAGMTGAFVALHLCRRRPQGTGHARDGLRIVMYVAQVILMRQAIGAQVSPEFLEVGAERYRTELASASLISRVTVVLYFTLATRNAPSRKAGSTAGLASSCTTASWGSFSCKAARKASSPFWCRRSLLRSGVDERLFVGMSGCPFMVYQVWVGRGRQLGAPASC